MRIGRMLGAVLATIAMCASGAVAAEAAAATVSISVTVTGPSGALTSGCVEVSAPARVAEDCTATAAGTYVIANLPRDTYDINVHGFAGYQDVAITDAVGFNAYMDSFTTSVKLKLFGIVKGRVMSTTGEPIASAPVSLRGGPIEGPNVELSATTDSGGYYRFDVPLDGTYSPRVGPMPNYGTWPKEGNVQSGVTVSGGTTSTYATITMAPGGTVIGNLVAPPGMAASTVCASVHLATNAQLRGSACGSPGEPFAISEVPVGKYFVCISADEAPPTCSTDVIGVTERVGYPNLSAHPSPGKQFVEVTTGSTVPFDVVWGGVVAATIKLDTGAVLDGGCLRLEAPARALDVTNCSGASGVFTFNVPMDLEAAQVVWTLSGAANAQGRSWTGFQSAFLGRAFTANWTAKALGDAAIGVTVVGEDSSPLAAGCVHLWTNESAPLEVASSCAAGSDHVFENLGPGSNTVSVTDVPGGFAKWWYGGGSGDIAVADWIDVGGDDDVEIPLVVPTTHQVSGTVVDASGTPLSGGTVEFSTSGGVVKATAPVSAGEFEFETPVEPGYLRAVGFDGFADTFLGGYYTASLQAATGPTKPRAVTGNAFVLRQEANLTGTIVAPPTLSDGEVCVQLRQAPGYSSFGPPACGSVGDPFDIPVIQGQSYQLCVRAAVGGVCAQYGATSADMVGMASAPVSFTAAVAGANQITYAFGGTRVVTVTDAVTGQPALDGCISHVVGGVVVAHGCVDENGVAQLVYAADFDWNYGTLEMRGFRDALDDDIDGFRDGVTNGATVALSVQVPPMQKLKGTITRPSSHPNTHACVFATDFASVFEQQCLEPGVSAYALSLPAGTYAVEFYTEEPGVAYEWYNNKPTLAGAQWVTITRWEGFTANASLAAGGRIAGVIRTANGSPATAGCATAFASDGSEAQSDCVDAQGRYALESLPLGNYRIEFTDVPGHALQWSGGQVTFEAASQVAVKAGVTSTVNATVAVAARAKGATTLNGVPVTGGCVEVYALSGNFVTDGCAESDGTYEITDLPPGAYKVLFRGFDGAADLWAGGATSFPKAAAYQFVAGSATTVNGALGVASTIRGEWDSYSGSNDRPATVYLYQLDGTLVEWTAATVTNSYHLSYSFEHVPPGKYELAISTDGESYSEYYKPAGSLTPGVVTIPSGSGVDVSGITFGAFAPNAVEEQGAINGYLNVPSTWASATVCAFAVSAAGSAVGGDCGPRGGYFEIPDLYPEDVYYRLVFTDGEIRTAAAFKSFTGAKRYFGNTSAVAGAPAYAVRNHTSSYLPVWFYTDVSYKTANFEAIQWMGDQGLYTATSYYPTKAMTRATFAVYLYKLAGSPKVTLPSKSPFKDVKVGAPGYAAMVWMYQKKYWTASTFAPSGNVTRATAALWLYRLAGSPAVTLPTKSPYSDVKKSTTVTYKAIVWAKSKRVMGASSGTSFKSTSSFSRAAGAVYLYNYWWYIG